MNVFNDLTNLKNHLQKLICKWFFINILLNELNNPTEFMLQDKIAGFVESATIDFGNGISKTFLAKLDTGNSATASTLEVGDFEDDGKFIQFNVDGFPRNEMLYLLYGLAICSAMSKSFNSFKDLINHLKSFIQLYLPTKCFNPIAEEKEKETVNDNYYNLITYLKTKDGNYNYRYKWKRYH